MDHHSEAGLTIVSGPRRSGKSTLARELVASGERRLIVDPLGEHGSMGRVLTLEDIHDWIGRGGGRGSWSVCTDVEETEADLVLRLVWELPPTSILVDEADLLGRSEALSLLCRYGRHAGHPTILCTRRPADLPPRARSNACRVIVFRTWERTDVDYFRSVLPEGASDALDSLPEWGFVDADLRSGSWRIS